MSIFYIAAHALVFNSDGKVLITRRSEANKYMPLVWDIPGGTVEIGETVENALIREIKEETDIDISPIKPIYVFSNLSQIPKRQTVQIIYDCEYKGGSIKLNPEEHDMYEWIAYTDIKQLKCIAFLEALLNDYNPYDF